MIGINNGLIENITLKISGNIDGKNASNVYVIGPMVASNTNKIILTDKTLVGVEGDIVVKNTTSISTVVVLGGVISENYGSISGAHLGPYIEEDDDLVKYDVYYGNQGATSDILLQVKGVGNQRSSAIGGVIGYNNGTMTNVYSTGKILGIDDSNALVVSNVGGLIGQNMGAILDNRGNPINYPYNIQTSIQAIDLNGDDKPDVNKVVFNSD
ncbi:MAG: hypothetical protein J6Q15_00785, partial [Clostridia bacterium]|nr:hypothetical protein [Clostridia bacterium]